MRHGYKTQKDAKSVKADLNGDLVEIDIERTKEYLSQNLRGYKDLSSLDMVTSPRARTKQTGDLVRQLYGCNPEARDLIPSHSLGDLTRIPAYATNQRVDLSPSDGGYSIFSDALIGWALKEMEGGANEWDNLRKIFMSDPKAGIISAINKADFGTSMPSFEVGERAYAYLNNIMQENNRPLLTISHSGIIEPLMAYSELIKQRTSIKHEREAFYENMEGLLEKMGDVQLGFVEPVELEFYEGKPQKIQFRGEEL